MKFTSFRIQNFKGIDDLTINFDKSPDANIYTLVGLNESGKTTILQAMNLFNPQNDDVSALELPGAIIKNLDSLIPVSKRDNFNETITLTITLKLEKEDVEKINEFAEKKTIFKKIKPTKKVVYYRHYRYKNSKFVELDSLWSGFSGKLKTETGNKYEIIGGDYHPKANIKLAALCKELIPSILYFPSFLFDFPTKIYLESNEEITNKENFYLDLIQDILYSLENNTNIKTHLVDRIYSEDEGDRKSLSRMIQLMERKVTDVVFEAWNRIFKRNILDTRIVLKYGISDNRTYLEFEIESEDGIYQINERSLGFRWFFTFLLFTQFRPFRKETPKNIIFLFDEPASNLHSSAQKQLLESFENLIKDSKIIYTTHSHHLINPHWLESTYVVKNNGLNIDQPEKYNVKKTKITIEAYRSFVLNHPHNTAYFQPILDVLDYAPSDLELIPNCILLEGKNDFYTLEYFQKVIFKKENCLSLLPSTGSGNLDTLISLHIGWGRNFIIMLDSDKEGGKQKERYINKFGIILENKIHTLENIKSDWSNKKMEDIFLTTDLLKFQKSCYSDSKKYNKTHFNRSIQENLMTKKEFKFSETTKGNINRIIKYLEKKLK